MKTKRDRPTKIVRSFQGFTVNVERVPGTTQQYTTADGKNAEQLWFVAYGYFPGKPSTDGDSLDAFLCFHEDAPNAYIVDQLKDGKFDQPKVMFGCRSAKEARSIFESHRWPNAFGGMRRLPIESLSQQLDAWTGTIAAERIDDQNEVPAEPDDKQMIDHVKTGFSQLVRSIAVAALAGGTLAPEIRDAVLAFTRDTGEPPIAPETRQDGVRMRVADVREVREDAREVDFVASTESIDSYGEIVKQNWRFERFAVNPVILFAHDSHSLPIGHATKFAVESNELRITVKFSTARANPFAELCFQSVLEKALRGGSVGFKPNTIRYEKHNDREVCVLDDNELFEFSVCPLPANPDGLAQLEQRMAKALGQTHEALLKSLSAIPVKPVDVQPKNKEGRVPEPKKKTLGDAEVGAIRTRGSCKVTCDCGGEMEIDMPMLAKMDDESKTLSAKVTTLEGDLATSKKALEDFTKQVVAEKRTLEVKTELDVLVKADKLLADDVEDLVTLGIEKPERYATRVKQIQERTPLGAVDLTKRVPLGGEANPQRGTANTTDKTFDATDLVNRATSDAYATRNTERGFAQSAGPSVDAGAMISLVNHAA